MTSGTPVASVLRPEVYHSAIKSYSCTSGYLTSVKLKGVKRVFMIAVLLLAAAGALEAQTQPDFPIARAAQPPTIDGVLDDEVWKQAPMPTGDWRSYNPLRGDTMPAELRTDVRIAYDDRNIYFAFHCFDNEPDKIRTTISRRDSVFNDDWIAAEPRFGRNRPDGVSPVRQPERRSDGCAEHVGVRASSSTPTSIWYSVGKVTGDGYVVEIQAAAADAPVLGRRRRCRMGLRLLSQDQPHGRVVLLAGDGCRANGYSTGRAHLVFSNLTQPRLIELLPSVTYGVTQARATAGSMERRRQRSRISA